jgi:hypothetical protein
MDMEDQGGGSYTDADINGLHRWLPLRRLTISPVQSLFWLTTTKAA